MKEPRPWDEPDPALERMAHPSGVVHLRTAAERDRIARVAASDQMNMEDPNDAQS